MKKRIMSLALTVVLLFSLCINVIPSMAARQTLTITATSDKQTVKPGDTITVTVSIGTITNMQAVWIRMDVPEGLTYISGSATIKDNVKTELNASSTTFTESSMIFLSDAKNYTSTEILELFTVQFKVNENASGALEIGFQPDEEENCYTDVSDICICDFKPTTVNVVIPATDIALNKSELTLNVGEKETLTATLTPANSTDAVAWSTDNSDVADVDATTGEVTAKKKGTANITATVGDKTAVCALTVNCLHTNKTDVTAEPSSCTEKGWSAYSECDDCGQLFDGESNEISEVPYLPLAEHTQGTAATCKKLAICSVCGDDYGEYAAHAYGSLIEKKPSTHLALGMEAHYECSVCNKLFDSAKNEVTEQELVIDMIPHVPGTWQTDETNHWKECTTVGCGVVIESTKTAHSFEWVADKAATEDETGLKHEECTVCAYTRNENTVIDKLDHVHVDIVKHAAVAATCNKTGTVEYYTCGSKKCDGKYYSDEKCQLEIKDIVTPVDKKNHVGDIEIKNKKNATATEKGYTGDKCCKACNEKLADGESFEVSFEVALLILNDDDIEYELKSAGYDTTAKITEALYAVALTDNYTKENSEIYDARLVVTFDNGETYEDVSKEEYPVGEKVTMTLPYPEGTDSSYEFKVVHMFATSANGQKVGDTEQPAVTKTASGISFEVNGFSPICVSWCKNASQAEVEKPETTADKTISESPKTGDDFNIGITLLVMLAAGAASVTLIQRGKKRSKI